MLTSKQRSTLRSLGNRLEPVVMVGKGGINENLIEQLDQVLNARELVKGRVLPHAIFEVDEVASELATRTNSEIVQIIGRNILFYRPPQPGTVSKLNWIAEE